ncbi:hypothetical protein PTSG_05636 [Salpingoeca rosetta]|uniref:VWFA domain-containing protein n=1 Tax=Salpingoeca rosetta (strain ATCC 50818 / BSB-021) TaxID=946362 RepID=F2UBS5_SALR5|nr:uncharacterized protein PTSG_05636 [Salpingoeca rosetta]EGD73941.1 hypothetical protein PTSG_05636 [Salpingoeca rosetta]UIX25864.1 voltage-gated calcium channel alpha2-delta subunit [Salpingoeca rosetta]|eukprot:XP_004993504.1 hypothetical protein PTSG_05636 [Salpingoeca rosetta]
MQQLMSVALVLVAFVAHAPVITAQQCPFFPDGRQPQRQPTLGNCTHYIESACCTRAEVSSVFAELPRLKAPKNKKDPSECYAEMNNLLCYFCSPAQSDFYREGVPVVCERMCNRVYRRCKRFSVNGVKMEDAYSSGTKFCEAQGFIVDSTPLADVPRGVPVYSTCHIYLDAASAVHPSIMLLAAVLLVSIGNACGLGSSSESNDEADKAAESKRTRQGTPKYTPAPTRAPTRSLPSAASTARASASINTTSIMRASVAVAVLALAVLCSVPSATAQTDTVDDADMVAWAAGVAQQLHTMRSQGTAANHLQNTIDTANYTKETIDAGARARMVADRLSDFFTRKEALARNLAAAAADAYMRHKQNPVILEQYANVDLPESLPDLTFSPFYKTNVSFAQSGTKVAIDEPQPSQAVDSDIAWTAGLDGDGVFTRNMQNDSDIRWQYVGTERGVFRQFPARLWDTNFIGFPLDFDPRFRPWYLATLSGPKDIVIVLDCSRSMRGDKWNDAVAMTKFLVNSLSRDDRYNVVCFSSSHKDYNDNFVYRRTEVLSCRKHELLRGTSSNKEDTFTRLDGYTPAGGTDPLTGIQVGFRLLRGECNGLDTDCPMRDPPRTDCQRLMVFLSDGKDRDNEVRCGRGRYYYTRNGRQYDPPPLCQFKWDDTFDYVRNNAGDIRIFSFGLSTSRNPVSSPRDGDELPGTVACSAKGTYTYVYSDRGLYQTMGDYFDYITRSTDIAGLAWSAPYIDALGLGLLMTVSVPVLDPDTNDVVAVAGIDVSLETIEDLLMEEQWGEVYGFLVDDTGDTVLHPQLRPAADLRDDPVFPDIRELEQTYDLDQQRFVPVEFDPVRELFAKKKNGSVFVPNAQRVIPQGDRQAGVNIYTEPTTYYVQPIPDSELLFGFAVPLKDVEFEFPGIPPVSREYYQHHMRLYDQTYRTQLADRGLIITTSDTTNITAPSHYAAKYQQLSVEFTGNDPVYPSLYISREHATFKLAAESYCDSVKYINHINDPEYFDNTELFIHTTDTNNTVFEDCPAGFFEMGVVADVRLVQGIEDEWKGAPSDVIWSYVGTTTGVSLFLPGHRLPHRYDPRTRPWYHQAYSLQNRAVPTIVTSPYLDVSGSGKIITIATTVFQSKANITQKACTTYLDCCEVDGDCRLSCYNVDGPCLGSQVGCTCSADSIHSVAAVDVTYETFHQIVEDAVPACTQSSTTRCFVIDSGGLLVYDAEIADALDGSTRSYERISVARRDGSVMRHLVAEGVLTRDDYVDYQGECSSTRPFDRLSVKGLREGLPPRDADVYDKFRGPQPRHDFLYTCVNDVIAYTAVRDALPVGTVSSGSTQANPCLQSQDMKITPIPNTNLYLVVAYNRREESTPMPFNCHIFNRAVDSGAFQIVNGTCAAAMTEEEPTLREQEMCPALYPVTLECSFNAASHTTPPPLVLFSSLLVAVLFLLCN